MGRKAVDLLFQGIPPQQTSAFLLGPIGTIHRESTASSIHLPPVLRRYLDNLHKHTPLPSSIAAACREWRLPRRSLEQYCQKFLHQSPGELLRTRRLHLASQLQASGYDPIEISAEIGFRQRRSLNKLKLRPPTPR
ncbi:MAG: helix-turn-helix domain-containing protein [Verrucomicrobia bacterium]|nr:helix-turn-helix domain-containing protein [Verrucomicrobiota bacterium]